MQGESFSSPDFERAEICMSLHYIRSNMGKRKKNSRKGKRNSRGSEDINDENGDGDVKRCPHIAKSVKIQNLQKKVPHTTLGQCVGCDRTSEEKHALSHYNSKHSHGIVVHLQNWVVWCYACDDEVPVEPESTIHGSIKLILKAMNRSPPPELESLCLSSSSKTSHDIKPREKKLNNNIRSRIKGLANLGNTCFFNAVMQNLCQTELLYVAASCTVKEGFSQHISLRSRGVPRLSVVVQETPGPVTKALWKLLQDFRDSSRGSLNPNQLFSEICKKATRFKGFRQQDSQELLRYLLDSIRSEEIKRVKRAILKSFGVSGEDDTKFLDDNKRVQIKEYGTCAEAPMIDSVFAGRLVSIVTCRQCRKEFKVDETFLDLSLPLMAPKQEPWNFKSFSNGKQNRASAKAPKNNGESTSSKSDDTEAVVEGKQCSTPSKHQLKAARRAQKKKAKNTRGKRGKGKESQESVDNSNKYNDGVDAEEREKEADEVEDEQKQNVSDAEDDELDDINLSGLYGSGEEQELSLSNESAVSLNDAYQGCDANPGDDAFVKDKNDKSSSSNSRSNNEDCSSDILNTGKRAFGPDSADADSESSSIDMLNNETKRLIVSSQLNSLDVETNAEEPNSLNVKTNAEEPSGCNPIVNVKEQTGYFEEQNRKQCFDREPGEKDAVELNSVLSSSRVTLEPVKELVADTRKGDSNAQSSPTNSSVDFALKAIKDAPSLLDCANNLSTELAESCKEGKDEDLACRANLPGGNSENLEALDNGTNSPGSSTTNISLNGLKDETESMANDSVTEILNNDQNVQDTEIDIKQTRPDHFARSETEEVENGESCEDVSETGSDEEYECQPRDERMLTRQPTYHPSPGECSVMSSLSYFCASELLDGSNKFACEECSKRAQRAQGCRNKKGSSTTAGERNKEGASQEDECKGAEAAKQKEPIRTVYTVATKQLLISLAPPVLTLHLKRFQQARFSLRKITTHVEFPLELNLAPFCSRSGRTRADSEGRVLYSLYGVIHHSGNMNSGHYTAYVKVSEPSAKGLYDSITDMSELVDFIQNMWTGNAERRQPHSTCRHEPAPDGQWYHVSDTSVSPVQETQVLKSQAYMLFYRRLPLCSK
ncbi:ubiquitin carboxyl-terminal hydrolase 16-like isoform X2 [Montipora foliosa]|uniref:ubiquitin carboxyl-terminal hydrolase 16-like isoform X2 n=2 Tax=Montipora TaxID=46703 RepID=UPI0035F218D4